MTGKHFEDRAPDAPRLTAYDEDHLADYIRLLDTDDEGADWRDAAAHIFGIDPRAEPERARVMHESHLARARWMTEVGYAYLLGPRATEWLTFRPEWIFPVADSDARAASHRAAFALSGCSASPDPRRSRLRTKSGWGGCSCRHRHDGARDVPAMRRPRPAAPNSPPRSFNATASIAQNGRVSGATPRRASE
ncbi:hypothetical protein LY284_07950 [Caballeronia sp. PC1]|nr:DUF2285 domain-containing protein [Caballeronia sp. PC1]MCE4542330.1 hypothetical protein [Caballeronia sp. PC1]